MVFLRRVLLALLVVSITGCSAFSLAYNNMPSIISTWLSVRVDLYDDQKQLLQKQLESLHAWHRREEVPKYLALLEGLKAKALANQLDREAMFQVFLESRQAYQRLVENAAPLTAAWLLTLYPNQPAQFQALMDDSNEDYQEEYLEVSETASEQSAELMVGRLEAIYGELSDTQVVQIKEWSNRKAEYVQERYQRRIQRQALWMGMVNQAANRQVDAQTLTSAILAATALRPVNNDHESMMDLFATVHQSSTAEQKSHAINYVQGWIDEFRSVLPQS